jgi:hypothetical protein
LSAGIFFVDNGCVHKALEKKYGCKIMFRGSGFQAMGNESPYALVFSKHFKKSSIYAIVKGANAMKVASTALAVVSNAIPCLPQTLDISSVPSKKGGDLMPSGLKRHASSRSDSANSTDGTANCQDDNLLYRHEKRPRRENAETVDSNQDTSRVFKLSLSFHHSSPKEFKFLNSKLFLSS